MARGPDAGAGSSPRGKERPPGPCCREVRHPPSKRGRGRRLNWHFSPLHLHPFATPQRRRKESETVPSFFRKATTARRSRLAIWHRTALSQTRFPICRAPFPLFLV